MVRAKIFILDNFTSPHVNNDLYSHENIHKSCKTLKMFTYIQPKLIISHAKLKKIQT